MTVPTILPQVVDEYFSLIEGPTRDRTIRTFATRAEVTDDGRTYRGHDAILTWLTGPASEYETTTTRLSASTAGHVVTVVNRLTGTFPGGVVDLRHEFVLDADGLIEVLTIAP